MGLFLLIANTLWVRKRLHQLVWSEAVYMSANAIFSAAALPMETVTLLCVLKFGGSMKEKEEITRGCRGEAVRGEETGIPY